MRPLVSAGDGLGSGVDFKKALRFFFFHSRVHSEVCATCDMVSQRMFRGGRTEFVRSPINQTLEFILAFNDPDMSVRTSGPVLDSLKLGSLLAGLTGSRAEFVLLLCRSVRQRSSCSEKPRMHIQS